MTHPRQPDDELPLDPDLDTSVEPLRPTVVAAIASGGALGASARYEVGHWLATRAGHLPISTLFVNITGSFVLGVLTVLLIDRYPPSRYARAFIAVGVIGAYTTMSTFAVDTDVLLRDGHWATAAVYVALSLVGGLGAAWSGIALGRRAFGPGGAVAS